MIKFLKAYDLLLYFYKKMFLILDVAHADPFFLYKLGPIIAISMKNKKPKPNKSGCGLNGKIWAKLGLQCKKSKEVINRVFFIFWMSNTF